MTSIATPLHLMNHTVTIKRSPEAKDASGGPTQTFTDYLIDIPARIQPMSGSEVVRYGRDSNRRMWRIILPTGYDITEKDRVEFFEFSTGSGITRTLDIIEGRDAQLSGAIRVLICEETA